MPHSAKTHRLGPKPHAPPDNRPSAARRGYTRLWRRLRAMQLHEYPLCALCQHQGRTVPAKHVHHLVALAAGGDNALENLQSLCAMHHNQVTAKGKEKL